MALAQAVKDQLRKTSMQLFGFQVRSPLRDKSTDQARIAGIDEAIQSALSGVKKEQAGLHHRLTQARDQAAFIYEGEEDGSYSERNEGVERELSEAESRLLAAEQRLRQLDEHLTKLRALDVYFKGNFA